ncbi:hypothetical protein E4P41_00005 [Geodermatophilus sp. DF01-2]|uniref:hypothetical protein n=1 Tax=Geodermatophilus sp. DF01-2 TaxID=2559610 RepID=UPI00107450FE|nr:hypothetical protein [Geodermatophilus sp. DF01_2]TFV64668.1 hypothetical protein E4P41_00005 [Geodermatophilus sp. DF01_2]
MWAWIVVGLGAWLLFAVVLALVVGRGIHLADRRSPGSAAALTNAGPAPAVSVVPVRTGRRRVPLPPVGVGLAASAVALETAGYVARLSGATGPAARLLSMDAPYSLPRMFIAALFAAAAFAAVAGAARNPGRRTWWLAVAAVAAAVSTVKAGSTVHADAMTALAGAAGFAGAVAVSAFVAACGLAALTFVSRTERRDRRRVLGCLAGYAGASVGLGAVAGVLDGHWAVAATFLEETGEALAGVAFLVAVLIGVAPRLVLPAGWVLRREDDAASLEAPQRLPGAEGAARG